MLWLKTKKENIFGLHITSTALTAVQLFCKKGKMEVVNFNRVPLDPEVIEDDCIVVNTEAFKKAMEQLLKKGKKDEIVSHDVIIAVPDEKIFSHTLSIPQGSIDDREAIMQVAKDLIPIELHEAIVDYKKIGQVGNEVIYSFAAIQKNIVQALIEVLQEIGLNVIAVDAAKNSLFRSCENAFQKNPKEVMVIHLNGDHATVNIQTNTGKFHEIKIEISTTEITKKAETIAKKAAEFIQVLMNEEPISIKTIYWIGKGAKAMEAEKSLQTHFPEAHVIQEFNYIHLDEETESEYPQAIGLALRGVTSIEDQEEINLSPREKKDQLTLLQLQPILIKTGIMALVVSGLIMLGLSAWVTQGYIRVITSQKEVEWTLEKSQNPHLNELAQGVQQKRLIEQQIATIFKNAIPVSLFVKIVDSYNTPSIQLINVSYSLNNTTGTHEQSVMSLKAKASDREQTEKFILALQSSPYFSDVLSPLTNLVGKGERFVNIDLVVNPEQLINDFQKNNPPSKP